MSISHQAARYFSRKEASNYLFERHGIRRSYEYLATLACKGGGPVFRKDGPRRAIYTGADLDAYAASVLSKPMRSTSEAA
ncbi:DNA-binding protein [Bradyrhizobium manausense]|uniref:DNA-binding protein n=1 Tax=Bradyrhizobium manausense TaxID=989370 RepID=UPI001BA910A0|nr:DNA-binding protein [Bradyrhizobium manausense]MBR0787767.1 DNA-binding protein [Bradyrhizobium manausense]